MKRVLYGVAAGVLGAVVLLAGPAMADAGDAAPSAGAQRPFTFLPAGPLGGLLGAVPSFSQGTTTFGNGGLFNGTGSPMFGNGGLFGSGAGSIGGFSLGSGG